MYEAPLQVGDQVRFAAAGRIETGELVGQVDDEPVWRVHTVDDEDFTVREEDLTLLERPESSWGSRDLLDRVRTMHQTFRDVHGHFSLQDNSALSTNLMILLDEIVEFRADISMALERQRDEEVLDFSQQLDVLPEDPD